jgi:hypothetical protein
MFIAEKKERFHDLVTFVSVKPIKKMARGEEKPGIEIAYKIGDGSKHKGAPWTKNAFADSLKNCKNVLTSLREGDPITLELTVNGNYKNLAGVIAGHIDNPNKVPYGDAAKKTTGGGQSFAKVAKTDYNERAAKGQALNLAMTAAISQGRGADDNYILSLIPRMLALGEAVQNGNLQLTASDGATELQPKQEAAFSKAPAVNADIGQREASTAVQPSIQQGSLDSTLDDLFGGL